GLDGGALELRRYRDEVHLGERAREPLHRLEARVGGLETLHRERHDHRAADAWLRLHGGGERRARGAPAGGRSREQRAAVTATVAVRLLERGDGGEHRAA